MIEAMSRELGESNTFTAHHGPPPTDNDNILDVYRQTVSNWKKSGKEYAIFDRAYPCTYILEQHRERNAGHFEDVVDFELELLESEIIVVHIGVFRPWYWSAPLHVNEIRSEKPCAALWHIRDKYIARMQEHEIYTQQLLHFYENITMFPSVQLNNEDTNGSNAVRLCLEIVARELN